MSELPMTRETLSLLDVRVEVLAGTEVGVAAAVALRLSQRLGCGVVFDFNGYDLHAYWPHDTARDVVARYDELCSRATRIKKESR